MSDMELRELMRNLTEHRHLMLSIDPTTLVTDTSVVYPRYKPSVVGGQALNWCFGWLLKFSSINLSSIEYSNYF